MRKLIMQMNVSLDGCADHRVAVADDELHAFAVQQLDDVDLLVFGRVTYELMEAYWPRAHDDPQATRSMLAFADKYNALPKIVFTRTLRKVEGKATRVVKDSVFEEVAKLKQQPGKNIGIGGISTCREFMKRGLIDEYVLLVQPVIWGKGKRLFDGSIKREGLQLIETKTFKSGVVVLRYSRS
jgi:dihydrofolate reductase